MQLLPTGTVTHRQQNPKTKEMHGAHSGLLYQLQVMDQFLELETRKKDQEQEQQYQAQLQQGNSGGGEQQLQLT